jgi:hypothetical protein
MKPATVDNALGRCLTTTCATVSLQHGSKALPVLPFNASRDVYLDEKACKSLTHNARRQTRQTNMPLETMVKVDYTCNLKSVGDKKKIQHSHDPQKAVDDDVIRIPTPSQVLVKVLYHDGFCTFLWLVS